MPATDVARISEERQRQFSELLAAGRVNDRTRIRFHPLAMGGGNGRFTVLRRDTGQMIATSEEGVEAITLMRRGMNLRDTRQALAHKFGADEAGVDLTELLSCLVQEDFLKSVDGYKLATVGHSIADRIRLWIAMHISSAWLMFLLKSCPLWLALPFVYMKRRRRPEVVGQIARNLEQAWELALTPAEVRRAANANYDAVRRVHLDQILLSTFPARTVDTWLRRYSTVTGLEHLDAAVAAGRGVVISGLHTGSYNLLPFILVARGYRVTALAHWREHGDEAAARRIAELARAGYAYPLTVVRGPLAMKILAKKLEQGEIVLMLCDTRTNDDPRLPVVDFFGTQLRVPQGLRWLRQRTGAAILPATLQWIQTRSHFLSTSNALCIGMPIEDDDPTSEVFRVLKSHVRKNPAQWLHWKNLHEMISASPNIAHDRR